jgi:hypothetical protein
MSSLVSPRRSSALRSFWGCILGVSPDLRREPINDVVFLRAGILDSFCFRRKRQHVSISGVRERPVQPPTIIRGVVRPFDRERCSELHV